MSELLSQIFQKNRYYYFASPENPEMTMGVDFHSFNEGLHIKTFSIDGETSQGNGKNLGFFEAINWRFEMVSPESGDFFYIVNRNSGLVLGVWGHDVKQNAIIQQFSKESEINKGFTEHIQWYIAETQPSQIGHHNGPLSIDRFRGSSISSPVITILNKKESSNEFKYALSCQNPSNGSQLTLQKFRSIERTPETSKWIIMPIDETNEAFSSYEIGEDLDSFGPLDYTPMLLTSIISDYSGVGSLALLLDISVEIFSNSPNTLQIYLNQLLEQIEIMLKEQFSLTNAQIHFSIVQQQMNNFKDWNELYSTTPVVGSNAYNMAKNSIDNIKDDLDEAILKLDKTGLIGLPYYQISVSFWLVVVKSYLIYYPTLSENVKNEFTTFVNYLYESSEEAYLKRILQLYEHILDKRRVASYEVVQDSAKQSASEKAKSQYKDDKKNRKTFSSDYNSELFISFNANFGYPYENLANWRTIEGDWNKYILNQN